MRVPKYHEIMLLKKNPKADLSKNSTTYFLIGLVLILFIVWRAIELKTYERDIELDRLSNMDDDEEDVPVTEMKITAPPPPPPPAAPQVIEVVENEEEVEETIIESTETDQEEIIEVDEIEVEDDDIEVPFAIIEDIPVFPGCEKVSKKKQRDCFQEKINKYIRNNFRYPEIAQEMGIQARVYVSFIIGKDGKVIMVKPRGPDKNLG
jgi:protein TonB